MIKAIVFDVGGVIIDYNPLYLYRAYFNTRDEAKRFIEKTFTTEWNENVECSKSLKKEIQKLKDGSFCHLELIELFDIKWKEMTKVKKKMLDILYQLSISYPLYGLTNMAGDRIKILDESYGFLKYFKKVFVSGNLGIRKPNKQIFELLIEQTRINAFELILIDDNEENILKAQILGINAVLFKSPHELLKDLFKFGVKI